MDKFSRRNGHVAFANIMWLLSPDTGAGSETRTRQQSLDDPDSRQDFRLSHGAKRTNPDSDPLFARLDRFISSSSQSTTNTHNHAHNHNHNADSNKGNKGNDNHNDNDDNNGHVGTRQ